MDAESPGRDEGQSTSPFAHSPEPPLGRRILPIAQQLRGYSLSILRHDALAGITVVALAIPAAMAYAELAGLPPTAGLYALVLPAIAYALLGSSRQIVFGPEGALSLLVATSIAPLAAHSASAYASLAAMLALMVGGIALLARLARIGWIADYLSRAVLVGYVHGVAIVLIVGQAGKLLGIPVSADDVPQQIVQIVRGVDDIHAESAIVGVVALAIMLALKWRRPRMPAALLVVVGGIIASSALDLAGHGVAVVGHIPAGLPAFSLPHVSAHDVLGLIVPALGIFAVGFADTILTGRTFADRHAQHVDANQELVAFGAANLAAGLTQGFSVGSSSSRAAVNDQVGGRTQVVGLIAAGVTAIVLLILTAPIAHLPTPVLAGVIIVAAIGLIDPGAWRELAKVSRAQVVIAAATSAGVILLGVLPALGIAIVLSMLDVILRTSRPNDAVLGYSHRLGRHADVTDQPDAQPHEGIVIYRLDDRLIFANARYVKQRILDAVNGADGEVRYLVFDAEGVSGMDASGLDAITQTIDELAAHDVVFVLARVKHHQRVRIDTTGLAERIGPSHIFPTVSAAVEWCEGQMRPSD